MDGPGFVFPTLINKSCYARTMADTGCHSYGVIDERFVRKHSLARISIPPRRLTGYEEGREGIINEVAVVETDMDGHREAKNYFYIVPRLSTYDLIIGNPWFIRNDAVYGAKKARIKIRVSQTVVWNRAVKADKPLDCAMITAAAYQMVTARRKGRPKIEVFAASMADINKALSHTKKSDPKELLPKQYTEFMDLFDREKAKVLPPHRGAADHHIELEKVDGKDPDIPWGPLYNMSRDELLVLRKTLTELLDKGFIRVSSSPAAAPVLFVKKPGGGLRFCVDYRGLNRITRKDRYPLPLIYETLRNIGRAKWYTKLDVSAAFYKLRIAAGDEWKTAFRTRYGLYEWLVTPFGLANAPSTFQKYINWALREFLDDFCSAYIDDVLIYTDGSLEEHRDHVRKVMIKMREAGLNLDIDKCEFEVKSTKYLGFIIEAGQGVRMDPEKVAAIVGWEAPKSVKGVQAFIGFANFYRRFIEGFSKLCRPIQELVRKDVAFKWTPEADLAFVALKKMFVSGPVLAAFDHTRETIMETDSSGYAIGGTLFQIGNDKIKRPVAYYSKKNNPAECNYEIYDKEMLAIIRCLEEWDAELRSVEKFQIKTDHKNLEYFMTVRKLTERQMRWSLILSKYNFTISYVKGVDNPMADALSRREQDFPQNDSDDRLQGRMTQLLQEKHFSSPTPDSPIHMAPIYIAPSSTSPATMDPASQVIQDMTSPRMEGEVSSLQDLWDTTKATDKTYEILSKAIRDGERKFPPSLEVKASIGECSLSPSGALLFRDRLWVPNSEPLRTKLIQAVHDGYLGGHPGREATFALMRRQYHWPGMAKDIRQVVRNCDICGSNTAWRERRQGFLKPLPIPSRMWREISMDFITDLPLSNGCTTLMVITDRLSKGVILEPMEFITAEAVATRFIKCFVRHHGWPFAIVSDRGPQFVGDMWTRVTRLMKVTRRVSTAFHPETDGATERMNQQVEAYLRAFVTYGQENWAPLLSIGELSINNRDAASTGVSPFFLGHGYHLDPVQIEEQLAPYDDRESPIQKADNIIRKIRDAAEWAQMSMAVAQQLQEDQANLHRTQAISYKVGDKVWLNLKNIKTARVSKKLDHKNAKFTVKEIIGSHSYRLDTPPGIHNVFHSMLLRPASYDPFPSQILYDTQPGPLIVGGEEEYEVEKILQEKLIRRGRGPPKLQYLVKWTGYVRPTWEMASALKNTIALATYEAQKANGTSSQPQAGRQARRERRLLREQANLASENSQNPTIRRKRGRPRIKP